MLLTADTTTSTPTRSWFAVQVKSRFENVAARILRERDLEVFLPLVRSRRLWSDRVVERSRPLFPGYLFCRFDFKDRSSPVVTVPGVVRILGCGTKPEPVSDSEIGAVQAIVASGFRFEPWQFLSAGRAIRIVHGPLAGIEGRLMRSKNKDQVVVDITLLQRSVAVDVEGIWVEPIGIAV